MNKYKSHSYRLLDIVALIFLLFSLVWCVLYFFFPGTGQDGVFFCHAKTNHYYDFFVPRAVARMPIPYVMDAFSNKIDPPCVKRVIQCYPALSNFWVGLFPENLVGAFGCTLIGAGVFICGLIVFFRQYIRERSFLATALVCCSAPFLFAATVGNLILYAVGFALVFLAWYNSTSQWRRFMAALSLAVATVLKITPVLLGLLYLGTGWRGRIKYIFISAFSAILLFSIPFLFCGGVSAWFENAVLMNHSGQFANANGFGWFGLVHMLVKSFTMSDIPFVYLRILRLFSSCFGLVVLVLGCVGKDSWTRGCGVVLGMLLIPPTMMGYTALYIIPFVVIGMCHVSSRIRGISVAYFLSLSVLVQMPLFLGPCGSLNACIAAAASIDMAIAVSSLSVVEFRHDNLTVSCNDKKCLGAVEE